MFIVPGKILLFFVSIIVFLLSLAKFLLFLVSKIACLLSLAAFFVFFGLIIFGCKGLAALFVIDASVLQQNYCVLVTKTTSHLDAVQQGSAPSSLLGHSPEGACSHDLARLRGEEELVTAGNDS